MADLFDEMMRDPAVAKAYIEEQQAEAERLAADSAETRAARAALPAPNTKDDGVAN